MKKQIFTIFILALMAVTANAQSYGKFKVDIMGGYAAPTGSGQKGGLAMSLEPKFNVTDNLALGAKLEIDALSVVTSSTSNDFSARAVTSIMLTGEYYLNQSGMRPFIGAAVGRFAYANINQATTSDNLSGTTAMGWAPRVGLQMGHFRIAGEYNLVKNSNFFSIKIGATIGGGRK